MGVLSTSMILGQLATIAPSGYVGDLSVADRSEARLRSLPAEGTAIDLETVPVVTLTMSGRRSDIAVGYSPALSYLDIENERLLTLSQSARVAFGWSATERTRLTLGADATVGRQVTLAQSAATQLAPPAAPRAQLNFVASLPVVYTVAYRVYAGASHRWTRRWTGDVNASYGGGGGLDDESRALVPTYRGPTADVSLTHATSRRDQLTTRVRGSSVSTIELGGEFLTGDVMEIWGHTWSERTVTSLGAGGLFLRSRPARNEPTTLGAAPVGEGTVTHTIALRRGETLALQAGGRFGVQFDPVLAVADPQVGASASATWAVHELALTALVDAVSTFPTDDDRLPARLASGHVSALYTPADLVQLEAGVRGYLQDLNVPETEPVSPGAPPAPAPPDALQWALFVAVRVQLPNLEF